MPPSSAPAITLNQLRAFLASARLGSFSAAATELRTTQPSVSELIKRMEDHYRVPLFTRGPRRLVLTAAGEELLPYAQQATEAADGADRALRSLTSLDGGVATFGLLRNADYYFLSELLESFHARHPKVRLRIVGLNSVEVARGPPAGNRTVARHPGDHPPRPPHAARTRSRPTARAGRPAYMIGGFAGALSRSSAPR
ncbi:LysR family transcriptional regulator [Streptomyces sp. NRRL S-1896]|uniref:LysR family transcriptional regulator n=1 Tax=Streptomyces sp. NRRL S-1896 TaxID=1463893 RepID=UPI001F325DD7|nr:LysR family transcriptional regulator [Streptomyces sp. NRRL S-1896]